MGDIIPFKKRKASEKHKGNTLCQRGFHKWKIETKPPFDVKQGKLVTRTVCLRCGIVKTKRI